MPCSSWSRIKDINKEGKRPGCRPLRTDDQPMGIAQHANGDPLTADELTKLQAANKLLTFSVNVVRACIKNKVMVSFENPQTSRVFQTKLFHDAVDHPDALWQKVSYCQYGMPWRKTTYFVTWLCPDLQLVACNSQGRCTQTGEPHVELIGKAETGGWKTRDAQAYPTALCAHIADKCLHPVRQELDRLQRCEDCPIPDNRKKTHRSQCPEKCYHCGSGALCCYTPGRHRWPTHHCYECANEEDSPEESDEYSPNHQPPYSPDELMKWQEAHKGRT